MPPRSWRETDPHTSHPHAELTTQTGLHHGHHVENRGDWWDGNNRPKGYAVPIPKILFRTVPTETDAQTEAWWESSVALTPGWQHITYRDPIDPDMFPVSVEHWDTCTSGAQRAGLIRLEAMIAHGGIYLDSDAELVRDPSSLLQLKGFGGYEDRNVVPDCIFGFEPRHPAVPLLLEDAVAHLSEGAWESGPGAFTRNLPGRSDVLLFPPATLMPYHYNRRDKARYGPGTPQGRHNFRQLVESSPWTIAAHHWQGSWLAK